MFIGDLLMAIAILRSFAQQEPVKGGETGKTGKNGSDEVVASGDKE